MSEIIISTLDWVPEGPRGFVRDLRLRWACEEAGLNYRMEAIPFENRHTNHLTKQPFGQVPFLKDGEIELFESGACLLHIGKKSEKLIPKDALSEAKTIQWTISALNSIEMVSVPWWFLEISGAKENNLTQWLESRLQHMESVFEKFDWLAANRFTVADLIMADVLRVPKIRSFGNRPATEAYLERILSREAFKKALSDQFAWFESADQNRN